MTTGFIQPQIKNIQLKGDTHLQTADTWKNEGVSINTIHRNYIKLTVTLFCPHCNGDVLITWEGTDPQDEITKPSFPSTSHCSDCGKECNISFLNRTIHQWKKLYGYVIRGCFNEQMNMYIPDHKSQNRSKMRRKKYNPNSLISNEYYLQLLQENKRLKKFLKIA